ncbi:MAG: hypothetical protein ACQESC_01420 [Nanobdellota archaeon]
MTTTLNDYLTKHNLLSIQEFENSIGTIDVDSESEKTILNTMIDQLSTLFEEISDLYEGLLQPDSSLQTMTEASSFPDEKRPEIQILYQQLQSFKRKQLLVKIKPTEQSKITFLKEAITFWKTIQPDIQEHITIITALWAKQEEKTTITEKYFG